MCCIEVPLQKVLLLAVLLSELQLQQQLLEEPLSAFLWQAQQLLQCGRCNR